MEESITTQGKKLGEIVKLLEILVRWDLADVNETIWLTYTGDCSFLYQSRTQSHLALWSAVGRQERL